MVKRILVGLAGTDYTDVAIQQAVELAAYHGSVLTGVTVLEPARIATRQAVPIGGGGIATELREHRQQVTQSRIEDATSMFVDACEAANITYQLEHEEGDAFKLMQSYSRYHDVTIFGLRSVFEYFFEDEDSSHLLEKLIRGGVRPIVAVSSSYRPIRRVLVAYSGSIESAKAMRRFIQLGLWPEVELKIATFSDCRENAKTLLSHARDYCLAHGYEAEVEAVPAPASLELLPHAAHWEADMIVMGNSARHLLMKRVFGETALHVMQNADRPLFLAQ